MSTVTKDQRPDHLQLDSVATYDRGVEIEAARVARTRGGGNERSRLAEVIRQTARQTARRAIDWAHEVR